jgi:hypothetical protein
MAYRLVASACGDGDCPSIWTDDSDGSVMVRGTADRQPLWRRLARRPIEHDIRYTADEWRTLMTQASTAGL